MHPAHAGVRGVVVGGRLGRAWPAALVVALDDASEDVEHELEVSGVVRAIDNGEGAGAESGGEFAAVVAGAAGALDDDRGRGLAEAAEHLEELHASLVGGVVVHGQGEVDDGDVDGVGVEDAGGLAAGTGAEGLDAHGLEHAGEAVDPGVVLPGAAGEQEVEAAAR